MFFLFLANAVQKPFDVSTLMMLKMIILIACDGIWVCKNRRHMPVEPFIYVFEASSFFCCFFFFAVFVLFS